VLSGLDRDLQHWIVTHRSGVFDPVFVGLSAIGFGGLVWIAAALALGLLWRNPRVFLLAAVAVWSADLVALVLKVVTDRPRPFVVRPDPEPIAGAALDVSFPSGHAATSFAGAAVLAWFAPRLAVPAFVLAVGIAFSRVYVGVHYPADVLVGALLGLVVAIALLKLAAVPRRSPPPPPPG
jgi:undecaprenyl-diphosphatase